MPKTMIIPVILCGGSGTRLWPASRDDHPKQFLKLMNEYSLLQNTMRRTLKACGADASSLVIVTLATMKDAVVRQLSEIDKAATAHILCEPAARNTAAAVALAADYVRNTFGEDAILWILPADHHIANEDALTEAFSSALKAAQENKLVTFGISPTQPDTGYGYIRVGDADHTGHVYGVRQFVEKPDLETAQSYLQSGDYLWNSGMFVFSAKTVLQSYEEFAPQTLVDLRAATAKSPTKPNAELYAKIKRQPFDKAIMENSPNVAVVPCDPQWSDIGSWESLWDIRTKDADSNVILGNATCSNATGCLIQGSDRMIAVAGLNDIVVVETDDTILIAHKSDNDSLKALVKTIKKNAAAQIAADTAIVNAPQPWTMVKTIAPEKAFKAKQVVLEYGQKIDDKSRDHGFILFTVLEGVATLTFNGTTRVLNAFETVNMDGTGPYTISNTGSAVLKLMQVQQGETEGLFFGKAAQSDSKKVA